jgi:hypothetical protein
MSSFYQKGSSMGNSEKDIQRIKQIIDELKNKYTTLGGDIEFVDIKIRMSEYGLPVTAGADTRPAWIWSGP